MVLAYALAVATAPAAQAQDFTAVNTVFYTRLESTLRYQEAILPTGRSTSNQYVQLGKRQVLLESVRTLGPSEAKHRVREDYRLAGTVRNPRSSGKVRYQLNVPQAQQGRPVAFGLFHDYPTEESVEANAFLLLQEFSPWELLRLRPGRAQSGQAVYVRNAAADFTGDTLACYALTRTGQTYQMVLQERRTPARRRWRHNTKVTCSWNIDLARRQIVATQPQGNGGITLRWTRTYANATDFSEVCTSTALPQWLGDLTNVFTLYSRTFQQKGPAGSADKYTLPNLVKTKPSSTFLIVSRYE
ncbi:hypothetical protein [Hymenobacter terricola]|uniref:hypothetical protein n=1 Tax=Hymenobacter terricola TaxID=2819236 RepID=UPI001CF1EEA3|nr:hypothetical protein [Hymenobacter terricola]